MGNGESVWTKAKLIPGITDPRKNECISRSQISPMSPTRVVTMPCSDKGIFSDIGNSFHRPIPHLTSQETSIVLLEVAESGRIVTYSVSIS